MDFDDTLKVSASALAAQSIRLRTIAENLANAGTTAQTPGGDPYRRKVVTFRNALDRASGAHLVEVDKIVPDTSPFTLRYSPGNPAADANGYIRTPNVNSLVELSDLRQAQQSYQANVDVIDTAKTMLTHALELLK